MPKSLYIALYLSRGFIDKDINIAINKNMHISIKEVINERF